MSSHAKEEVCKITNTVHDFLNKVDQSSFCKIPVVNYVCEALDDVGDLVNGVVNDVDKCKNIAQAVCKNTGAYKSGGHDIRNKLNGMCNNAGMM